MPLVDIQLTWTAASVTATAVVTLRVPPEDGAVTGAVDALSAPLAVLRVWLTPSLVARAVVSSAPVLLPASSLRAEDTSALASSGGTDGGAFGEASTGWAIAGGVVGASIVLACVILYVCHRRTQHELQVLQLRELSVARDLTSLSSLEPTLPGLTELEQWSSEISPVLTPRGGACGAPGSRTYSEISTSIGAGLTSPRQRWPAAPPTAAVTAAVTASPRCGGPAVAASTIVLEDIDAAIAAQAL